MVPFYWLGILKLMNYRELWFWDLSAGRCSSLPVLLEASPDFADLRRVGVVVGPANDFHGGRIMEVERDEKSTSGYSKSNRISLRMVTLGCLF